MQTIRDVSYNAHIIAVSSGSSAVLFYASLGTYWDSETETLIITFCEDEGFIAIYFVLCWHRFVSVGEYCGNITA